MGMIRGAPLTPEGFLRDDSDTVPGVVRSACRLRFVVRPLIRIESRSANEEQKNSVESTLGSLPN